MPPVVLSPAGVTIIDIRRALSSAPPEVKEHFTEFGSAAVKYQWHWTGAATAMVQNRDIKHSLNFNFELHPPMAMQHQPATIVKEGMWWKEDPGVKGFLALTNITGRPVAVQVELISQQGESAGGQTIELRANETRQLNLLEAGDVDSGGIRVTYEGTDKDVILAGGLENPQEGYSAQMPFVSVGAAGSQSAISLSSVGLMVGKPAPMMKFPAHTQFGIYLAARNTTNLPVAITPTLYYMQGSAVRTRTLSQLALAPRQSKHWNPKELAEIAGLHGFSGSVNFVFSYPGNPGDVLLANGSIDQTRTYVFEITLQPVGKSQTKGLKSWDVANGNDTMISVVNLGESAQNLILTLFFERGRYKFPLHLEIGGSAMLSVSDIIQRQQPDADGKLIPKGTLHGTAVLSGTAGYAEFIDVGVSIGILNVSTATCTGGCPVCYGYDAFGVQGVQPTATVGGTATFRSIAHGQNGQWQTINRAAWSSGNPNVASSQGSGNFHGISPANFFADSSVFLTDIGNDCAIGPQASCSSSPYSGQAPGKIQRPTDSRITETISQHAASCPSGQSGWFRLVNKIITDQDGNDILSVGQSLLENLTVNKPDPLGGGDNVTISPTTTGAGGIFGDTYQICSSACPSTKTDSVTQVILDDYIAQIYVLNPVNLVYGCSSITADGK